LALIAGSGPVIGALEQARPWYVPLSPREAEIAVLVAAGLSTVEIAKHFGRSERTLRVRIAYILEKLNVPKRSDISAWVATHRPRGSAAV
jgi:DNA-binding NarL/FixJ family response regulator